jgi:hypothetical protein
MSIDDTDPEVVPNILDEHWHQDEDADTANLVDDYLSLNAKKKLHESAIKDIQRELDDVVQRLQNRMDGHKHVRTLWGHTLSWVYKKRKEYTVAAKEWEAFEIRSPH